MNRTSIEWCNRPETRGPVGAMTWNPIRARLKGASHKARSGTFCTRISPGCTHCYASTINKRFGNGLEFTVPNLEQIEFFVDDRFLDQPLQQKKPCTIFVGDMFDLFHEAIPENLIDAVVVAAAFADWHTFQFLTKRTQRMRDYFLNLRLDGMRGLQPAYGKLYPWPFRNFWLGTSVESQRYADERIPLLLQTPAEVRFLSVEPMLEMVDLDGDKANHVHALGCGDDNHRDLKGTCRGVDWVICGGESGPGARQFNLAWAQSLLDQCSAAGVPFFMKQLGSNSYWKTEAREKLISSGGSDGFTRQSVRDRKGGNPAEWPESLRVREFPSQKAEVVSA